MRDPVDQTEYRQPHEHHSLFWPIILIGVGIVWLLINFGFIHIPSLNILLRFWPVILILVGLDIIFAHRHSLIGAILGLVTIGLMVVALIWGGALAGIAPATGLLAFYNVGDVKSQRFSAAAGSAESAVIKLDLNRWETRVTALADSNNLIEADVDYLGEFSLDVRDEQDIKTITAHETSPGLALLDSFLPNTYRWDIGLSPNIPMQLDIDTASGASDLDLTKLQLTGMNIEGGSGSTVLTMPVAESAIPVTIRTRSGSFKVAMPNHSAADLEIVSGSGSVKYTLGDQSRVSLHWEGGSGSQNMVIGNDVALDADIESGSGSVSIDLPDNAAVRIQVTHRGSGSIRMPGWLQQTEGDDEEGTWESSGYNNATTRITIRLATSSGSVTIN